MSKMPAGFAVKPATVWEFKHPAEDLDGQVESYRKMYQCEPVPEMDTQDTFIGVQRFILAGKAVFTLTRPDGKHYTYRVNKAKPHKDGREVWFVNVGIGYEDSIYAGMLVRTDPRDIPGPMMLTAKSKVGSESPSYQTFVRWWQDVRGPTGVSAYRFQHEGKCCVCGRPLTNPDSIDAGIGPECAGKEGGG